MATYENQQFIDLSDEHSATHRSMNKDTRPATALAHERYQRQFHSRSTHSEEPRPANSYSLPTKQPISLPEYTFGGTQTSQFLLTTNQTTNQTTNFTPGVHIWRKPDQQILTYYQPDQPILTHHQPAQHHYLSRIFNQTANQPPHSLVCNPSR
jgi:hypothetical protein